MLCSVGAPWHREHKERLVPVLPDSLYELYGLTEGFVTVLDSRDFASKPDSVGVPIPFSEMRIIADDGHELPPCLPEQRDHQRGHSDARRGRQNQSR